MNRKTPKVSRNKTKNNIGIPIVIKKFPAKISDNNTLIRKFLNSASVDEQLVILKNIIDEQKDSYDSILIEFFTIVFYEAPAKHPVKCFLTRHVTKCSSIQKLFTELLYARILSQIEGLYQDDVYKNYLELVPKVLMCIENFPTGAAAVERIDPKLLMKHIFINYFVRCRTDLRNSSLSPTKKNEMFNLEHLMLRLLMHIVQKVNLDKEENLSSWGNILHSVTYCIEELIFDEEVPMDTKSLSGILFLSLESLISGADFWKMVLEAEGIHQYSDIFKYKAGQLAVYSAIATTVPMDQLQDRTYSGDTPYILVLLDNLLGFADGSATEPAFTLIVSRSLLHLSKSLADITAEGVGPRVVPLLLAFVWPHLEFHLDSVRHLAQQILVNVLGYCAALEKDVGDVPGNPEPLAALLQSIRALGRGKSLYWSVCGGAAALGADRVLREVCSARHLLAAACSLHLHAAVSGAITALISRSSGDAEAVFAEWVQPSIPLPAARDVVIAAAVEKHPHIATLICERVRGSALLACCRAAPHCVARLPRGTLRAAAAHAHLEMRLLSLSLLVESRRSTAALSQESLSLVLTFLRYNINAPQPGFQHAMLANVKKLLKRLEDSYRVLKKESSTAGQHYIQFVERLRQLCFNSALRGTNYGRRSAALQLLACTERLQLGEHHWEWKEEYVETLLLHLDDSYDTNKAFALQVLQVCPQQLLQSNNYSTSLELSDILRQATSLRPADSAAAAYKLLLLLSKGKERILERRQGQANYHGEAALRAHHVLVQVLVESLQHERGKQQRARAAGMFGVLHCLAAVLRDADLPWSPALSEAASQVEAALAEALPAVCCAAPEGHLPFADHGGSECIFYSDEALEDGRPVTSQMVLVCAWRTVKEAAAVLGTLSARMNVWTCLVSGDALVRMLLHAQHRGALEQGAAGLHALARGCWLAEDRQHFPRKWLRVLMQEAGEGEGHRTRRGAGLPAAIQALVSSELVTGRAECFHECMGALLLQAAGGGSENTTRRTLAANILRALFRHSALEGVAQAYVAAGLRVAVCGFDAEAWPERTAMSLLFAALTVRTFGVVRARGAALDARNKLAGRVFFQRYPELYELMLSKLSEDVVSEGGGSSFAVLLVLARLLPSAAEGAASSLKLSAFVPPVQRCSRSAVLKTRQLAAAALRSLIPPNEYFIYISRMFSIISDREIPRNHCHGILLQLVKLLEDPPPSPISYPSKTCPFPAPASVWILAQSGGSRPCYVIAREYVNVVNLLLWRFPELLENDTINAIRACLKNLLFSDQIPLITAGRETCLADCLYLYLILLHKDRNLDQILQVTLQTIQHKSYEVVLASLNHLLILHEKLDIEDCSFQQHLNSVCDKQFLELMRIKSKYINILSDVLRNCKYLECQRKSLRLLTLEDNTQMILIGEEMRSYVSYPYDWMINKLIRCLNSLVDENVTHMILESLLRLTSANLGDVVLPSSIRAVMWTVYERSSSENSDSTRLVVVSYLEKNLETMMSTDLSAMSDVEKFQYKATILATLVTLLEDDDDDIRQRTADVVTKLVRPVLFGNVSPEKDTPENVSPEKDTPENVTPEKDTPENVMPEKDTPENVMPEKDTPENVSPEKDTPENVSPEKDTPKNVSPEKDTPENVTPEKDTPENVMPEKDTPENVMPEKDTPVNVSPEKDTPENVSPEKDTSENVSPEKDMPENVTPEKNVTLGDGSLGKETLAHVIFENDGRVVPSLSGEMLRDYVETMEHSAALFVMLALLDFKSEVCMTDELSDECRVFDQSERYNIFLEESVWTAACAEKIIKINQTNNGNLVDYVLSILYDKKYTFTFQNLCKDNYVLFGKMAKDGLVKDEIMNPKIELFVRKLRG